MQVQSLPAPALVSGCSTCVVNVMQGQSSPAPGWASIWVTCVVVNVMQGQSSLTPAWVGGCTTCVVVNVTQGQSSPAPAWASVCTMPSVTLTARRRPASARQSHCRRHRHAQSPSSPSTPRRRSSGRRPSRPCLMETIHPGI